MRVDGFKWKCKIGPDGRLSDGAWIHESVIPKNLPAREVLFGEFPETTNGGADYIWDGSTLTLCPAPAEEKAALPPGDNRPEEEGVMTYA